jgi:subtilisin family serine protease
MKRLVTGLTLLASTTVLNAGYNEIKQSAVLPLYDTYFNLSGDGVKVGLVDSGFVGTYKEGALIEHPALTNRVNNIDPFINGFETIGSHATHVAGIIGASDLNKSAQGVAPLVTLTALNKNHVSDSMSIRNLHDMGINISNHSYTSSIENSYENSDAIYLDQVINEMPYSVVVYAAGNGNDYKGYDLSSQALAKNIITVGSFNRATNIKFVEDEMGDIITDKLGGSLLSYDLLDLSSKFSKKGGKYTSRIKPDVVAGGLGVTSTYGFTGIEDFDYFKESGTSMATPFVTGLSTLIAEYYTRKTNKDIRSDMLKAVLINGAIDKELKGPDYNVGFGLVNGFNSALIIDSINSNKPLLTTNTISENGTIMYDLVLDKKSAVKMTMVWIDALNDNLTDDLVADLDITIEDDLGNVYYAYSCDMNNRNKPATNDTFNRVDNVEQIEASLKAGSYKVVVKGYKVDTKNRLQDFAIASNYTLTLVNSNNNLSSTEYPFPKL